jgi:uncharacterized membrane protein HdeD (DUF308 family)
VIQTLTKNWWLLALCGVLDAVISVIYFDHAEHGFHGLRDIVFLGRVALAAGACTITVGLWRSAKGKSWLLVLNGVALGALGLISNGVFGSRISLRTIALLMILMAVSIGTLESVTARTLWHQRHVADGWFLGSAGVASIGFALAFFALGFHWIKLGPGSSADILWFGSYFGFSAICILGLALRLHSKSGQREASPLLGNPSPAH